MMLDKEKICKEYTETKIGIEALATKYHVGKLKIKSILSEAGIETKNRGGQSNNNGYVVPDWRIKKYPLVDGYHYVAIDRLSGYITNDWNNTAGVLTTHIRKEYAVDIPTLYDRRQYYMSTGNYWWEQWFDILLRENKTTKKCPYCDWETIDTENKSGCFELHLKTKHNMSKTDYISEHPEDKEYFIGVSAQKNLILYDDENKYVVCNICGKRLRRIDMHHLRIHGITKQQYIEKYGDNNLTCTEYHNKVVNIIHEVNTHATFHKESVAENDIKNFIKSFGYRVKSDRKILDGMEIDIYIPELKIGFEYNGCRYHSEKYGKDKYYHVNKTKQCYDKGVMLYHIFEDDYYYHKDILFSKIQHILGKSDGIRVGARDCVVKEISSSESNNFLNKNHIQGKANATIYMGAFYGDNLVSVMLFVNTGKYNWNMVRFATDINYNVVGIGGKLLKHFIRTHEYKEIKTFAERRFTPNIENNLYTNLGFTLDSVEPPDYRYYNSKVDRYKRFHKFGFRKQILHRKYGLPLTMTEKEMTENLGYSKIWDCGLIKYVYRNQNI